jgi:hypothetical protein
MGSVVIVGGNDCMVCQYKNLCKKYNCKAKVFTQMKGSFKDQIGSPDLMVLFTNTTSHKMVRCAVDGTKGTDTKVVRCHSSSMSALKNILDENVQAVS